MLRRQAPCPVFKSIKSNARENETYDDTKGGAAWINYAWWRLGVCIVLLYINLVGQAGLAAGRVVVCHPGEVEEGGSILYGEAGWRR